MLANLLLAVSALGTASCPIPDEVLDEHRAGYCELPADVRRFVARRDLCDHFRGEDPYDDQRRRFLVQRMERDCRGTDAELAALMRRHRNESTVIERLNRYETETGF